MRYEQQNIQPVLSLSFGFSRGAIVGLVMYGIILVGGFLCSIALSRAPNSYALCYDQPNLPPLFIASGLFWPGLGIESWLNLMASMTSPTHFYASFNGLLMLFFSTAILVVPGLFFVLIGSWGSKGFSGKTILLTCLLIAGYGYMAFMTAMMSFVACLG